MKVLVTGANGFLGSRTVAALRRRGHEVRAMVRSPSGGRSLGWESDPGIEVVRADLRNAKNLTELCLGVDAVCHLAAVVTGGDDDMLAATVVGTERLLAAMNGAEVRRLVLCSSFSVYNYRKIPIGGEISEESPLLDKPDLYKLNGYTVAKTWQERLARRWAAEHQGELTVLRPGFIWGPGHEDQPCLGDRFGPVRLVIDPSRPLALTHVENCAHAFAAATEDPRAIGETFNVVDVEDVPRMAYARRYRREIKSRYLLLPIPYSVGYAVAWLATRTSKLIYRGKGKLPSLLVPHRFEPRFKFFRPTRRRLSERLGWEQPYTYEEALRRTYRGRPGSEARSPGLERGAPSEARPLPDPALLQSMLPCDGAEAPAAHSALAPPANSEASKLEGSDSPRAANS